MRYPNPMYRAMASWALAVSLGAGAIALAILGRTLNRQNQVVEADQHAGGNIIVRNEVVRLWLPQTLLELAKRQTANTVIRTHDDLRRTLDGQHQRNVWYALTVRGHQVSGEFGDITFIRWPHRDTRNFPELLDVLAVAAQRPPRDTPMDYSVATLYVVPDHLVDREPREVIGEVLATGLH